MTTNHENKYDRQITPVERFFSHSPFSIVTLVVRIKGNVTEEMLRGAVNKLQQRHINLRYHIVGHEDNSRWFSSEGTSDIPIEIISRKQPDDWIHLVQRSNKIPFEFETDPAIKIIMVHSPEISELIITCHHIICDGISLAYLARDLMSYLGTPDQEMEPLPDPSPISLENLPEDIALNGITKFFMKRINKKWNADKVIFDQEDYRTITDVYWQNFTHPMLSVELSEEVTSALIKRCKQENVSVNSALTTAFSAAPVFIEGEKPYQSRIIVASNLRDRIPSPPGEGMGMYAGGVELQFDYDQDQSFWDNSRRFHDQITPLFTNKNMFKEALTWSFLEPSITEAMNFKKLGALVPSGAHRYKKLINFSQQKDVVQSILNREKLDSLDNIFIGSAVTNLTRLDFPTQYGNLELDRMIFKPGGAFPLSNVNLLVGAVTCAGKLSLVIEYSDQNFDTGTMGRIKDKAISLLTT